MNPSDQGLFGSDAHSPGEIAARIEAVGVAKARLPGPSMVVLGILAGGFIGLGALYFTLMSALGGGLPLAASRLLAGVAFSLGLVLIVVAGAELFTGNNLLVMAWVSGRIKRWELVTNWIVTLVSNSVGAAGLAFLVLLSGHPAMFDGAIATQTVQIAVAKISIPMPEAFFRGVLCNIFVCLAIWMAMGGRSVTDRILAVILPVSAFAAAGFEHSVANIYFFSLAMMLKGSPILTPAQDAALTWSGCWNNLIPVIMGNIVGGGVLVGCVYGIVYGRKPDRTGWLDPRIPTQISPKERE